MAKSVKRNVLYNLDGAMGRNRRSTLETLIIKPGTTFKEFKEEIGASNIYLLQASPKVVNYSEDMYEKLKTDHATLEVYFPETITNQEFRKRIRKHNIFT